MDGTVIVADDDRTIRTVLSQALTRAGCRVRSTSTIATMWQWIEAGEGDVVVYRRERNGQSTGCANFA